MLPSCGRFWKRSALSDNPDRWFFVISHAYIFWIFQKKNKKIEKYFFKFFLNFFLNFFDIFLIFFLKFSKKCAFVGNRERSFEKTPFQRLMLHLQTCPNSNVTLWYTRVKCRIFGLVRLRMWRFKAFSSQRVHRSAAQSRNSSIKRKRKTPTFHLLPACKMTHFRNHPIL